MNETQILFAFAWPRQPGTACDQYLMRWDRDGDPVYTEDPEKAMTWAYLKSAMGFLLYRTRENGEDDGPRGTGQWNSGLVPVIIRKKKVEVTEVFKVEDLEWDGDPNLPTSAPPFFK